MGNGPYVLGMGFRFCFLGLSMGVISARFSALVHMPCSVSPQRGIVAGNPLVAARQRQVTGTGPAPSEELKTSGSGVGGRSDIGRDAFRSPPKPYTYWPPRVDATQRLPALAGHAAPVAYFDNPPLKRESHST